MAQECGFFNAQLVGEEYDRVYLAEHFAAYFASFIGNGIFGSSMQQLEVTANNDMTTNVLSGQAWINGWWYRNTDVYTLSHSVADGVLSRIDIVVLRWDHSARDMYLAVIEGTLSANPIKPPIVRNADYYDLQLCEVSIPAGSVRITQAQITDTRLDNSVCGLVTGVVDQIDTTDLYNQFEAYFAQWKANQQVDFETWFDNIKGQISDDEGVRIQLELDEHTESTILSHPGLHGLRYYNDELQVYDEENDEWVSAAPDQLRPTSIEKVSTSGTSETYKLTYSDGSFTTVTAPQGLLKGTCTGALSANHTAVATLTTSQFRNIKASTTDLTAGSSTLTSGDIYIVYE